MIRKLRDFAVCFFLFCKRLLRKSAFLILLLLIPITALVMKTNLSDNGSVLRIGLCSENSAVGNKIIENLTNGKKSIIGFEVYSTEVEARNAVIENKVDGAWIFPENLEKQISLNVKIGIAKPIVKVIERESTVPLRLSHELLFGELHPYISYSNYVTFTQKRYGGATDVDEEELKYYYDNANIDQVIEIYKLGDEKTAKISTDFLTLPLRGMLSLIIVLCGIASVMYFLIDKSDGRFDRIPPIRRIVPAFCSCLAATLISGIAVIVSLGIMGSPIGLIYEICLMLLYIFCVCGFCMFLAVLFSKASLLGAFIPFIMIIMLVQCPIFFNMDSSRPLGFLLPPSYYLYAVYDVKYILYMAIYAVCSFAGSFVLNYLINAKRI